MDVFRRRLREEQECPKDVEKLVLQALCDICECTAYVVDTTTPSVVAVKPSGTWFPPDAPSLLFVHHDGAYHVAVSTELPVCVRPFPSVLVVYIETPKVAPGMT